ncbi:ACC synthase [Zalerion maritima]|uniref:ACC synthase n=1 Tax=Zalerion maritima TaxID=339359 RepID=A0AAD5WU79_9PEZI|nr:ACC synthase [Zalerion maritima]
MASDAHTSASGLSDRGGSAASLFSSMAIWEVLQSLYDPATNPGGYVSLGVAENTLLHDTLSEHIHSNISLTNHAFTYGEGPGGSKRLKESMSRFLTKHFKPVVPIKPSHILVTNGCSGAIEHLSWVLANPGEGFLLGQPYYGAFPFDLKFRTGAKVIEVPFGKTDPLGLDAVAKYEAALLKAELEGTKIKGLVLCHPHNPLGRCYAPEVIVEIMKMCQKHDISLISDEIYGLSVWENTVDTPPTPVEFRSTLSINTEGVMDPSRLHVIWGMSKDFGANGIRIGSVISQHNPSLMSALGAVGLYSSASSISEHVTANIFDDKAWTESYLAQNRKLLSEQYAIAANWAKTNTIEYARGGNAAFFLWVDLGTAYRARHPDCKDEKVGDMVMKALLKEKVFLASGEGFGAEEDGWFRIVFSHPTVYLSEGLRRVLAALSTDQLSIQVEGLST